jgi:hypothetical protein
MTTIGGNARLPASPARAVTPPAPSASRLCSTPCKMVSAICRSCRPECRISWRCTSSWTSRVLRSSALASRSRRSMGPGILRTPSPAAAPLRAARQLLCLYRRRRTKPKTDATNKQTKKLHSYPRDKEWKQLSLIQRGACTSALVRARSSVRSIRGGGTRHGLLLEMMTSSGGRARRCGAASSWQQGRGEERLRPVSKHEIKLSLREKRRKRARLLRTEAPTRPEEHRHHDRHRRDHRHPGRGARNRIRRHPPHRAQPPRAAHDRSAHRHEAM